eukprot:7381265-Prymnesium_polylepis.1
MFRPDRPRLHLLHEGTPEAARHPQGGEHPERRRPRRVQGARVGEGHRIKDERQASRASSKCCIAADRARRPWWNAAAPKTRPAAERVTRRDANSQLAVDGIPRPMTQSGVGGDRL